MTASAATLALLAAAATTAAWSPPSGRPPTGPLERVDAKVYDVTFEVTLATVLSLDASTQQVFELHDTPIVMPLVFQSTFSRIDPASVGAAMWFGANPVRTLPSVMRLDDGYPFSTRLLVLPVAQFRGQSLRWRVTHRAQVWSSRLDEAGAAQLTWPREWPPEAQDGLKPQMFIESDDPLFRETVARVSEGRLRLVPPWLAAKDLVRYAIGNIQEVGDGLDRRGHGFLHGLEMQGALATARSGRGSPHDIVCVCVAMLRAAGIPARPVIGMQEGRRVSAEFASWAELYLEGAGWIPFDPAEMNGKGVARLDVRRPWPEMGTMDDLNDRVPLAFHFIAPATVESPQAPALWGWDPRPKGAPSADQFIRLSMVSRGHVRTPE